MSFCALVSLGVSQHKKEILFFVAVVVVFSGGGRGFL